MKSFRQPNFSFQGGKKSVCSQVNEHIEKYASLFFFGNTFFKKIYLFIFRERGKEGEKHQCVVASYVPSTGDLAHNLGWYPRLGIELSTL